MGTFNDSIKQGQKETREELIRIKKGEGLSDEYSFKIAGKILGICFVITIFAFFYSWLHYHMNFFLSLILSVFVWVISSLTIVILFALIFKLASRSDRYKTK